MQLTDINGNIYGIAGLEVTGIDGKPKVPVIPATLIVNSTPITGGAVGRVLFEGAGNVLQESSNLFWDNVNNRLGIGTTTPADLLTLNSNGSNARIRFNNTNSARWTIGNIATDNSFRIGNALDFQLAIFQATGNVVIQNGGTFTDSGFRLDVNGKARVQGEANVSFLSLSGNTAVNNSGTTMILGASGAWAGVRVPRYFETTGSISAASAIARGTYLNQTLVATANNDVLVELDIQPTFTNGTFTGVTNYLLRAGAGIGLRNDGVVFWGNSLSGNNRGILTWDTNRAIISSGTSLTALDLAVNLTTGLKLFTSRSVMIQNGGTFTEEASSQLTVNSTTRGFLPPRMTNAQMLAIASPAAGLVVYDTTNNKHYGYDGTTWNAFF